MVSNWQALLVQMVRKNVFDVCILANFNNLLKEKKSLSSTLLRKHTHRLLTFYYSTHVNL